MALGLEDELVVLVEVGSLRVPEVALVVQGEGADGGEPLVLQVVEGALVEPLQGGDGPLLLVAVEVGDGAVELEGAVDFVGGLLVVALEGDQVAVGLEGDFEGGSAGFGLVVVVAPVVFDPVDVAVGSEAALAIAVVVVGDSHEAVERLVESGGLEPEGALRRSRPGCAGG